MEKSRNLFTRNTESKTRGKNAKSSKIKEIQFVTKIHEGEQTFQRVSNLLRKAMGKC